MSIADMDDHGFEFDAAWFKPHWEFRFPLLGQVQYENVGLELRTALEPWHVMGEEGAVGGTVRYVDCSVERLEVKSSGLVQGRHQVLVNGKPMPLRPVDHSSNGVGGAWAACASRPGSRRMACIPPSSRMSPLTIEIWDGWRKRSIGGCTYHAAHPGGRNFEVFPVNAYEAEGRRLARFAPFGFTGGTFVPPRLAANPDFPYTLDLRRGS